MGEARRRRLAGTYPKPEPFEWTPEARADLIAMVHAGMAQDPDSTLMGATLILPGSDPLYMSAADARKRPKARH